MTNQIQKDTFSMMRVDVAAAIKLQCDREYGFGDMNEEDPRATQHYKLARQSLKICKLTISMPIKTWQNLATLQL